MPGRRRPGEQRPEVSLEFVAPVAEELRSGRRQGEHTASRRSLDSTNASSHPPWVSSEGAAKPQWGYPAAHVAVTDAAVRRPPIGVASIEQWGERLAAATRLFTPTMRSRTPRRCEHDGHEPVRVRKPVVKRGLRELSPPVTPTSRAAPTGGHTAGDASLGCSRPRRSRSSRSAGRGFRSPRPSEVVWAFPTPRWLWPRHPARV